MSEQPKNRATARCACGSVELEATGAPIASVACYCDDCQEGSRQIEALPDAPPVRDPYGGTEYILYRKDRVRSTRGAELLRGHKLREGSATNRVVATCCNSAMIMNFEDSRHWVPVYRARFGSAAPPLEMRIQTKFMPEDSDIPGEVPSYPSFPLRFMAKLSAAGIGMLLRR